MVGQRLSPEDAAEIRRAVAEAVATGEKLKFRLDRAQGGGGGEGPLDINIQTLVKGEE